MQFQNLAAYTEINHGFIGRDGTLDAIPVKNYVFSEQIHGTDIHDLRESLRGIRHLKEYDSLVTTKKNVGLVVKGADCVPLLFYAPDKKVIATCHAGRVGTEKGAAKLLVEYLIETYQVNPQLIVCGIGPSICKNCYQIDRETNIHYDLWKNNFQQLISTGVKKENIEIPGWCTSCNQHDKFYSYRKDKTDKRNYGWIYLK